MFYFILLLFSLFNTLRATDAERLLTMQVLLTCNSTERSEHVALFKALCLHHKGIVYTREST